MKTRAGALYKVRLASCALRQILCQHQIDKTYSVTFSVGSVHYGIATKCTIDIDLAFFPVGCVHWGTWQRDVMGMTFAVACAAFLSRCHKVSSHLVSDGVAGLGGSASVMFCYDP